MTYITSAELIGRERGLEEGLLQGIQPGIEKGLEQGREVKRNQEPRSRGGSEDKEF